MPSLFFSRLLVRKLFTFSTTSPELSNKLNGNLVWAIGVTSRSTIGKKGKRKDQGVPQSQTAALPRHQEEEETDKSKRAQIDQTYDCFDRKSNMAAMAGILKLCFEVLILNQKVDWLTQNFVGNIGEFCRSRKKNMPISNPRCLLCPRSWKSILNFTWTLNLLDSKLSRTYRGDLQI